MKEKCIATKNYLIKIKFNETNESKRIKTKLIDTNKAY